MNLAYLRRSAACALLAAVPAAWGQQEPIDISVKPPGVVGVTSGTGEYPAHAVSVASMPMNTLYVPAELPDRALPLLIWGTGGCRDNGLRYSHFLREVASHGFIVISGGHPRFERPPQPPGAGDSTVSGEPDPISELEDTRVSQLLAAIDWAGEQNVDPNSPYHGKIDLANIGVMGHSCGGLQAIALLSDKRVATAIAFNSGVLTRPPPGQESTNVNLIVSKSVLQDLNGPIAYIVGGPSDIAYENALDDLERIEDVPVFFGENGVGHGGTFRYDENGGEYANVATAWMSWQLKGDAQGAQWFAGADCRLCTQAHWKVQKKGID